MSSEGSSSKDSRTTTASNRMHIQAIPPNEHFRFEVDGTVVATVLEYLRVGGLEQNPIYIKKFGTMPIKTTFPTVEAYVRYLAFVLEIPYVQNEQGKEDFLPSDWLATKWAETIFRRHPLRIEVGADLKPVLVAVVLEKARDNGIDQDPFYLEKFGQMPIKTKFDCFGDLRRYITFMFDIPDGGDILDGIQG